MSVEDVAADREAMSQLHVWHSGDGGRSWTESDFGSSPRVPNHCPHDPRCAVKVGRISLSIDNRSRAHVAYTAGPQGREPFALFFRRSVEASGRSWTEPSRVSDAPRPESRDASDHDFAMIAAADDNHVCAAWVDDRRGDLDVWARCSTDAGNAWGPEFRLSNRDDGASYKSARGFQGFYGHYGGAAIDAAGALHVVWGAGAPAYRTGTVWVNRLTSSETSARAF